MGIGFAIPINLASSVMQSLIATGTVARGFLGVGVDPLTPELAEAMGRDAKGMATRGEMFEIAGFGWKWCELAGWQLVAKGISIIIPCQAKQTRK